MANIELIKGDITKIAVDAIVNAANSGLRGGGGVDGAIHRAGGPEIMEECRKIGGCPTGEAVITTAGKLPGKFVIHTVGPVWQGGNHNEKALLQSAYLNSLRLANGQGCKSISFPNISTGVYGFPKERAAKIGLKAAQDFAPEAENDFRILFVCFDDENYTLYQALMDN